jgi:methyl-accepting chemotaxis protein
MLLLEGGAAGHIMHLYEDYDLTFNKLKNIIEKLTSNQVLCTEKTDGLNIYFGYKGGKTKAVRNKSEFKFGGLDKQQFGDREFQSGNSVKETFNAAFNSFDRSLFNLTDTEKVDIFGQNSDIFLNCEVISGKINIIPYDKSYILIHRSGHKRFNEATGILSIIPEEENVRLSKTIEILLPKLNENLSDTNFQIKQTPFKNLNQTTDTIYIDELLKELNKFGFSDEITIKQFLHSRIVKNINETIRNQKISEQLANKIMDLPTNELLLADTEIQDREGLKTSINRILQNKTNIKKEAIKPIETIVHKIGVVLLQNQQSDFIQNDEQAIQTIKQEVEAAINKLQTLYSQDQEKLQKASREIEKIGNIDDINSSIEGIVFQVNDKVYKLTGNFAPINQIVNLTESKQLQRRTIVIYPGRFQPFHKGHLAAYRYLTDKFGQENVNIFTSDIVNDNSPLNFEERKRVMNFAGVPNEYIWYAAEPYKAEEVVNNIKGIDPNQTTLVYAISMKDMIEDPRFSFKPNPDGSPSYMQPYKDSFEPMNKHCYVLTYPKVDFKVLDKEFDSSAQIREYYPTLDNDQQRLFIRDLYGKYSKDIQKIMNKKTPSSVSINEILNMINEMSGAGAAGGGLEGGTISLSSNKKEKNKEVVTHSIDDILAKVNELFKEKENE